MSGLLFKAAAISASRLFGSGSVVFSGKPAPPPVLPGGIAFCGKPLPPPVLPGGWATAEAASSSPNKVALIIDVRMTNLLFSR